VHIGIEAGTPVQQLRLLAVLIQRAYAVCKLLAASVCVWLLTPLLVVALMHDGLEVSTQEHTGFWNAARNAMFALRQYIRCLAWAVNAGIVFLLVFCPVLFTGAAVDLY
jgi:hypothetical protein